MVNCLKQIAQFGIEKQIHVAGLQQELESLEAMPPEARVGIWMFEWYWKQPGVAGVDKFVADIRKVNGGKVPTARHWFGYTSVHTLAAVANKEKTLDSRKLAEALGGFELAPEVRLQPNKCYYRKGDHQLMGREEEAEIRRRAFAAYQVNEELMALARPGALFMTNLEDAALGQLANQIGTIVLGPAR